MHSNPETDTRALRKIQEQPLSSKELSLHGSIFCELFDSAGDAESVIMLMRFLAEIGDEKDFPLLEYYADHAQSEIREAAQSLIRTVRKS
jgi:hypothetical protein